MPRLKTPRVGTRLQINEKTIVFSFWPIKSSGRGTRGLQTPIFTNDPWNIIQGIINSECKQSRKETANYFFNQAYDFYKSSLNSLIVAAKPLQIY
jgi:hypothetical protein